MIRPSRVDDLPALKTVIDANELFPSEMLDEMMSDYFDDQNSSELWLTDQDLSLIHI